MSEIDQDTLDNTPDIVPVLDDIDRAIINIAKCNPEYTTNQIGKDIVSIGKVKSIDAIYKRIRRNTYLQGEISKLREMIKEDHSRTIFPLAHDRMKKALKNKDLHDKDVFPYVKLAYDKELSSKEEKTGDVGATQINIDSLQIMINKAID